MGDGPKVFFPLASNGHSLLMGRPLEAVRKRLKVASILHDQVFLESGLLKIQAGATGAVSFGTASSDVDAEWQTPAERGALQSSEFVLTIGRPDADPTGSSGATLRSPSAIAWSPTFEPFRRELPGGVDWIHFGRFNTAAAKAASSAARWRSRDDSNEALARKLPDSLVRQQVLGHVQKDLAVAMASGVRASIDPLHARVLNSRFIDPRVQSRGFALSFLVPRAGEMSWADIAEVRKHKSISSLRKELADIELESISHVSHHGELPDAVAKAYLARLERYVLDAPSVSRAIGFGVAEMAVGGAIGFATAGIGLAGLAVSAVPGAAITAIDASKAHGLKERTRWITALQVIRSKTSSAA